MKRRSFFAWLLAAVFGWNARSKEALPLINPYLTDDHAWYLKDTPIETIEWWWRGKDGRIWCDGKLMPHNQMPFTVMEEL